MKQVLVIIFFVLVSLSVKASQKSEAFVVEFNDSNIQVLSPDVRRNQVSVVIKNNTLDKLTSKLSTVDNDIEFFSVPSQMTKVFDIKLKNNEKLFVVPLSPSMQEIELVFSRKAYAIPSKN
ncbi:MAG: hypothetical protein JNM93_02480 [Bacteriovoracaceae bacterium]|nr:hypothetical protein [Bacteriovoracaceae bacterium]